ncbi:DUF2779 domain-containing protein, partial [Romboutsia sp.]|uniref:DUF2779 domain-containing protein n=1 Tax=Romboutsia sp. TaxID=1965302 RepID=UPI003F413D74
MFNKKIIDFTLEELRKLLISDNMYMNIRENCNIKSESSMTRFIYLLIYDEIKKTNNNKNTMYQKYFLVNQNYGSKNSGAVDNVIKKYFKVDTVEDANKNCEEVLEDVITVRELIEKLISISENRNYIEDFNEIKKALEAIESSEETNIFEGLVSVGEASTRYNVSESTVKRFIREGKIVNGVDCKNYGKQWVIKAEALARVFEKENDSQVIPSYVIRKNILTKADYLNGVKCPKSLWLSKNRQDLKENEINDKLEDIKSVKEIARNLYPNGIYVQQNVSVEDMINETKENMQHRKIIYNGTFEYKDILVKCDILNPTNEGWELYQVKIKSKVEKKDIESIASELSIQQHVLKQLGYEINKVSLIHINGSYERNGELIPGEFLQITDFTEHILKTEAIESNISNIKNYLEEKDEPTKEIGQYCLKIRECDFINYCWKDIPENSVFDIDGRSMQTKTKFKNYENGVITFEDLSKERTINEKVKIQVEAELQDKQFIDKEEIKSFMDTLHYPMYFLDFETFQQTVPLYNGLKPYQQIPFQYSLHYIEYEGAELMHKEFLAKEGKDPREEFAKSLVNDIPTDACIIVYNKSFEQSRIRELA